jgi:8-oxo-dGTP pyrophosphatase MutT (NUDIX family)
MPQGGIDDGEEPQAAALRELAEETGVSKARIVGETADWVSYDLPIELAATLWRGRYKGQRQKWFAAKFLGTDSDIRLDAHTPEFRAWRWTAIRAFGTPMHHKTPCRPHARPSARCCAARPIWRGWRLETKHAARPRASSAVISTYAASG